MRTSPTCRPPEASVPGLLALIEGSLPSGRYRARELVGCRSVSALELPVRLEAHEPPEARGVGRDDVAHARCDAARPRARPRPFPRAAAVPVRGRPARRQHLGDAAGRARRPPRRATVAALALDAGTRRHLARRAADERPAPLPATASGRSPRAPRRRPGRAARTIRRQRSTLRRAIRARRAARGLPSPARAADPIRLRPRGRGRSTRTRPSSPSSPGAPRCRAPAGPSRRSS